MNSQDFRNLQEAYLDVYENEQLDELSDKLVSAARNKLANRTNRSVNPLSRRDTYGQDINRETRMNDKIQARNKRTGSNVEPTFTRRHEQLDLYDIILSHLIDEGYADTEQTAEAIMVNMSEEWKEIIVVEDIESRRAMLRQKSTQQRISSAEAQKRRKFKEQDRESLKREIIRDLIRRQQSSTN